MAWYRGYQKETCGFDGGLAFFAVAAPSTCLQVWAINTAYDEETSRRRRRAGRRQAAAAAEKPTQAAAPSAAPAAAASPTSNGRAISTPSPRFPPAAQRAGWHRFGAGGIHRGYRWFGVQRAWVSKRCPVVQRDFERRGATGQPSRFQRSVRHLVSAVRSSNSERMEAAKKPGVAPGFSCLHIRVKVEFEIANFSCL